MNNAHILKLKFMDASLASTISAIGNTSTSHRANELVSDLKKKKKKIKVTIIKW